MPTVDYLPFATGGGANVETQAAYASDSTTGTGFLAGLAQSLKLNKVWRQASMAAACVATFISNELNINVLDDGNLATLVANFTAAIELAAGSAVHPARVYSASGPVVVLLTDYAVGLNISASEVVNLPTGPANGQEFVFEDVAGNFAPGLTATITPPAGTTIAGLATYIMNEARQSITVRYYATGTVWGVKSS